MRRVEHPVIDLYDFDCSAFLYRCDGSSWCFDNKDPATGYYRVSPPDARATLQRTSGGWIETEIRSDGSAGFKFNYDEESEGGNLVGILKTIESPGGDVWTISYSSPISGIQGPDGRRTTYAYDSSGNLQQIVDVTGRVTTFVVDSDGNLVQHITPELCMTELIYGTSYDERHKLKAHVAPDGCRTSFSYDGNGWCNGIQLPTRGSHDVHVR